MKPRSTRMPTDPVGGVNIDPARSDVAILYNTHAFHFCRQDCPDRFHGDCERFVRMAREGLEGVWARYLDRVPKVTDGKPSCCH